MFKSRPIQYLGLLLLVAAALAVVFYPTGPKPQPQTFETRLLAPKPWQELAPKGKSITEVADDLLNAEFKDRIPSGRLTVIADESGQTTGSRLAVIQDTASTQPEAESRRQRIVAAVSKKFPGVTIAPASDPLTGFPPQPVLTLADLAVFPLRREQGRIIPAVKLGLDLRGGVSLVLQVRRALFSYHFDKQLGNDPDENYRFTGQVREAIRNSSEAGLFQDVNINLAPNQNNVLEVRTQAKDRAEFDRQKAALDTILKDVGGVHFTPARDPQFFDPAAQSQSVQGLSSTQLLNRTVEIVRSRVDKLGVSEPQIQALPPNRIIVQLPGVNDPQKAIAIVGQTAQMQIVLLPQELQPVPDPSDPNNTLFTDKSGNAVPPAEVLRRSQVLVRGEDVKPTSNAVLLPGDEPAVTFELQGEGARRFAEATTKFSKRTTGQNYYMPIFLDEKCISAPVINEPITGGSGQISGGFANIDEARQLSLLLNSGALPAPIDVVENRTVSATLGTDSLVKSLRAGAIGFVIVILFMIAFYKLPGVMANCAVIIYIILNLAFFNLVGGTLTLPGIAGFLLAMAMSFDTNILIFERLKEELEIQPTFLKALHAAFARAWTAILDSHVTTLIAAAVLFYFGTGPVKGFALTLGIGVILSLFTAISVTRLFLWSIAGIGEHHPTLFAHLRHQDTAIATQTQTP
jgi:SecD/SecF fusion protein